MADGVSPTLTACSEGSSQGRLLLSGAHGVYFLQSPRSLTLVIYLIRGQVGKYTTLLPLSLLRMQGLNIAPPHWARQDASAHCSSLIWRFWGSNP